MRSLRPGKEFHATGRGLFCALAIGLFGCLGAQAQEAAPAETTPEPTRPKIIQLSPLTPSPAIRRPRAPRVPPVSADPSAPLAAAPATAPVAEPVNESYTYCNQTSFRVQVAVGVKRQDQYTTRGWWTINPGSCSVVIKGVLEPTAYYTFARTHFLHVGPGRVWGGNHMLCTGRGQFHATSDGTGQCGPGLESQGFAKIDTSGRTFWKTTLTEGTALNTLSAAMIAGLQRLMADVRLYDGPINGDDNAKFREALSGLRTRLAMTDADDNSALYVRLANEVLQVQESLGLTMCNRTKDALWLALGHARQGRRSSKGWWRIQAGQCEKVIKEALSDRYIFAYAASDAAERALPPWSGSYIFCTRDAVFDLDGGENCEARSARSTGFFAIDTGGRTGAVFQFTPQTGPGAAATQ